MVFDRFKKMAAGNTDKQMATRNEKYKKMKSELLQILGVENDLHEFPSLGDMVRAMNNGYAGGRPLCDDKRQIHSYICDWTRKEKHGTSLWYVLTDQAGKAIKVLWVLTTQDSKGRVMGGAKIYDMRQVEKDQKPFDEGIGIFNR